MRIVIAGIPRAGKSTLADQLRTELGYELLRTDNLISMGWSEASAKAAEWMLERRGPWIVEGVAAIRALRKALAAGPDKPCEKLFWLSSPFVELTPGQRTMGKGAETVLHEIEPDLRARGVLFIANGAGAVVQARPSSRVPAPAGAAADASSFLPAPGAAPAAVQPLPRTQLPRITTGRWGNSRGRGFG